MKTLLMIVIGYLIGSIPWALVIGLVFFHKDVRTEGSHNLGGTNAGRVLGKPAGIAVILLDAFKAFLTMLLAHYIAPGTEIYSGLACCAGHCFPLFAHFKGGKAVATSYGYLLGIASFCTQEWFWNFFWVILCFFLILYLFRMVSLASISALAIEVITSFVLYGLGRNTLEVPVSLLLLWIFITWRHRTNIHRILSHTESHVKWMGPELWGK